MEFEIVEVKVFRVATPNKRLRASETMVLKFPCRFPLIRVMVIHKCQRNRDIELAGSWPKWFRTRCPSFYPLKS